MTTPYKKNPADSASPIETYRKTDMLTANKETILLMMYAGAVRFLKRAKEQHEKGDNAERNRWLLRVQEIVTELRSTLNFELGGEIAQKLNGLYAYATRKLNEAMLENKLEAIVEVTEILSTLNEGWEQAAEAQKKERSKITEAAK